MDDIQPTPPVSDQPANPELERIQHKAQTFGVVGLVTAVFVPLVGVGFGIATLVQAAKASTHSKQVGEQPSRQFGTQRTMGIVAIIVGAIMSVVMLLGTIFLITTLGVIASSIGSNPDYSLRIDAMESANKVFESSDTIEFGSYDLTLKDLQKSYTPTAEEVSVIQPKLDLNDKYRTNYFTEANPVYTKFTISLERNKERAEIYDSIEMDVPSWGSALSQIELDGYTCVADTTERQLRKYNAAYFDGSADPIAISYICLGPTAVPSELELNVSAFSAVSPFVGTEGMPRQDFTYIVKF